MDRTADALRDKDVAAETLDGKILVGDFDVFLSYNSKDKAFVGSVARQLKEKGILPWMDDEQIRPGEQWQKALERDLKRIKCAVVFVTANGIRPWQDQEIQAFLQELSRRKRVVIPAVLPDKSEGNARQKRVRLPLFLKNMQWVDFRDEESRPLDRLIWGITGVKSFGQNAMQVRRASR